MLIWLIITSSVFIDLFKSAQGKVNSGHKRSKEIAGPVWSKERKTWNDLRMGLEAEKAEKTRQDGYRLETFLKYTKGYSLKPALWRYNWL